MIGGDPPYRATRRAKDWIRDIQTLAEAVWDPKRGLHVEADQRVAAVRVVHRCAQQGRQEDSAFILVNPAGTDLRREDRFNFETIRVGLSYRF